MANAIYPKFKQSQLDGDTDIDLNDGTVKAALIDTGTYTYSASDQFYSDLSGVVGTPGTLVNKTITNGLFDADDLTLSAVSGATVEAVVIYIDTGTTSTSRLVAYLDTGITGFPVTPNGGDIALQFNASGIVQF